MGWSGYEPRFYISCTVDAHGGEAEERGEKLYQQFVDEIDAAITAIVTKPEYAEIKPYYGGSACCG